MLLIRGATKNRIVRQGGPLYGLSHNRSSSGKFFLPNILKDSLHVKRLSEVGARK